MRETGMRENGIVLRIQTGRGGRVHELKSGKEEGEKKKVSSPFHPQDPIGNSLLLPRYISLKIRGESLVLLQNDTLRLIRLSVLKTYLQDNKLEPQGEVTCWSSLGVKGWNETYLFYLLASDNELWTNVTSGRRITLWYSQWRWNSEKLQNSISSNKRLFKISAKGEGGGALLRRMVLNRGGLLLIACSDSTAVEAWKVIAKVAKESGFLCVPSSWGNEGRDGVGVWGGAWGWALIRRRALLRALVLIQRNAV